MLHQKFKDCIAAGLACAVACNHCAISCLSEKDVKMMAKCIGLDLECAAVCRSAAELMSLGSNYSVQLCRICSDACKACAEECNKHDMKHCQECAAACRDCASACEAMAIAA
ncbi:four-helix bundle copper-binding protein [Mucilaginibacter glaciei]|uniref:Four-helix bundle copper-binding protein n=1 Tax=Mucilaginibacter glaciei TaxID=2772109 RepID=A0A926S7V6_9SPHI|nr:four-helix bundle copper-binding protein [Mucilaginibacter glaciei]